MTLSLEEELEYIACEIRACRLCRLWQSRTHAVPGEGNTRASLFLVGEAPGRAEDESGRPFTGLAGRELERLLALAGLRREDIFVTSVNKCCPPGNRRPRRDEMATCRRAYLDRQLAIVAPRLVVLMGGVAAQEMLGAKELGAVIGRVIEREGRSYFVTYHPAASMRFPAARRAAQRHFRRLAKTARGSRRTARQA
jgi:DNA polymerase